MITIDLINTFLAFWLKPMLLLAFIFSVVKNTYHFSAAASHWLLVCALFITGIGVTGLFWLPSVSIGILPQAIVPWMTTEIHLSNASNTSLYWLTALYVLGVLWILSFQLMGFGAILSLTRSARVIESAPLNASVNKIVSLYGIKKTIRVVESSGIVSPVMWGFFNPVIILPTTFRSWPKDRIERVLAHELSHVARHDWLTKISAKFVCAFLWPVPMVWYVVNKVEWFAELSCDDKVIKSLDCRAEYAQDLLSLGADENTMQQHSVSSWTVSFTRNSSIYLRIQHVLDGRNQRTGLTHKRRWLDVILCSFMIIPISSLHAVPHVEPEVYQIIHFNPVVDKAIAANQWKKELAPEPHTVIPNDRPIKDDVLAGNICSEEYCEWISEGRLLRILPSSRYSTEEVFVTASDLDIELDVSQYNREQVKDEFAKEFAKNKLPVPHMEVKGMVPQVMVMPVYPKRALRRGIEGKVIVQFDIDEHGATFNARIVHAQPKRIFDKAVLKALKKSKFTPMKIEGQAVKTKNITEEYNFKLYERTTNTKAIERPKYTRIAQMSQ